MGTTYLTDGDDLTSVANAIRAKSGGSSQLAFPAGFVSEIQAIPSGGGGQTLTLLASGTYTKSDAAAGTMLIPVTFTGTPVMFCVTADDNVSGVQQTYRWASLLYDNMPTQMHDAISIVASTVPDAAIAVTTLTNGNKSNGKPNRATITSDGKIDVRQIGSSYPVQPNTYKWYIWGYAT